jgi:uncharacterized membrane protein
MSDASFSFLGDAKDEHLLHRLEAFSDIVIGFCLAQLTFSLRNPFSQGATGFTNLYAFGLTFLLIVAMWWLHNRLFSKLFAINAVTVVANFIMLGALMLMIYFLGGITASFNTPTMPDSVILSILRAWFLSAAVAFAMLCLMFGIGLWKRWSVVSRADLRFGVFRAFNTGAATLLFASIGALLPRLHPRQLLIAGACFAVLMFAARRLSKRLFPDEAPAAASE